MKILASARISFVTDQTGKVAELIRHQRGRDAVAWSEAARRKREHHNDQMESIFDCGHRRLVLHLRRGHVDAGFRQVVGLPAFRLLPSRHMQQDRRLAGA
jgi:hypothetical protein